MSFHHLDQFASVRSPITGVAPVARMLGTAVLALGVSILPLAAWPQMGLMLALALSFTLAAKIPLWSLALRLSGPFAFVFLASVALLVLVPGNVVATIGLLRITDSGLVRFGSVLGRALVALTAAVVLVSTTRFPELVHALRLLRLPRAVTIALALAYRLLYVTLDESERILRAARSRNAGQGAANRRWLLASLVAAVIQRSLVRSERTHQAMLARGFSGDLIALHPTSLDARSMVLLFAVVLVVSCVAISAYIGP